MKDSIGYAGETPEWRADYDAALAELDREFPAVNAVAAIFEEKFRKHLRVGLFLPIPPKQRGHIIVDPLPPKPEPLTSLPGRKPTHPSNNSVG